MYPEKFTFENLKHRPARVNEVAIIMYPIFDALEEKKNGQVTNFRPHPLVVQPKWVRIIL